MRLFTVACLASVLLILRLESLPGPVVVILMLLVLSAAAVLLPVSRPVIAGSVTAILMLSIALLDVSSHQLRDDQIGSDLRLIVRVTSVPASTSERLQFEATVIECSSCHDNFGPQRLQLNWYRTRQAVHAGETWQLTVRLKPMVGLHNAGGFDRTRWALAAGLHARGYVRSTPVAQQLAAAPPVDLPSIREKLATRLASLDSAAAGVSLVQALTVGVRQGVEPAVRSLLQDTGTSHLLAISGLHISMIAAWGYLCGRWLGSLPHTLFTQGWRVGRGLDAGTLSLVCSLVAALGYAMLAGFGLPVQRALIMLAVWVFAGLRFRVIGFTTGFSIALLAVLLHNPLGILSVGFWLSFGTVAILFYLHHGHQRAAGSRLRQLPRLLRTHVMLGVMLLPVTALFFQSASVIAPLANLVAIPWVGLVVVPLSFLALLLSLFAPGLASLVLQLAQLAIALLLQWLQWLVDVLAGSVTLVMPSVTVAVLCVGGLLVLFSPRGPGVRWLALPLLLPSLWFNLQAEAPDGFEVHVLDVGQGLAVLVFSEQQTLLFDTGGKLGKRLSMFEAVVVPFLHAHGRRKIDTLVVSHTDEDHSFGVSDVLRRYPDVRLIGGQALADDILAEAGIGLSAGRVELCEAGVQWQDHATVFSFIHPGVGDTGSGNDLSCVLLIHQGAGRALLTGDIEAAGEARLVTRLEQAGERLAEGAGLTIPVDVLVAPHHGSRTSSTHRFIRFLQPGHVVYTAGYANRYGFPHADVQSRYEKTGAMPYITGTEGAVSFSFNRSGLDQQPSTWWHSHRRFWHGIIDPACPGLHSGQSLVLRLVQPCAQG